MGFQHAKLQCPFPKTEAAWAIFHDPILDEREPQSNLEMLLEQQEVRHLRIFSVERFLCEAGVYDEQRRNRPPAAQIRLPRRADISLRSVPSVHRNQAAAAACHNHSWKMERALRQTNSNIYRSTFSSMKLLMDTDVRKHWFTFISFNTVALWLEIHFRRKPIVLGLI